MDIDAERIDRTGWPSGPWDEEPDRVDFTTAAGYPGLVLRHPERGFLCGYVAIPPTHPWHPAAKAGGDHEEELEVHGGITYGGTCRGRVCHVPAPGEPDDVYWFGFDCAHVGDRQPNDEPYSGDEYRSVAYVRAECEKLAVQLTAKARPMSALASGATGRG